MKKTLFIILTLLLLMPQIASAATCNTGRILPACVCDGNCSISDFVAMFINLAQFFLGIVGLIALYFLVMGGFTLIVASGDPQKIQAGKKSIVSALIGLFVVLAAWIIVNSLFFALSGTDVTFFNKKWWELKTAPGAIAPPAGDCSDLSSIAQQYSAAYPAQDAPSLSTLKNCISNNVPGDMIDQAQIYTTDRNHPTCNYTRGNPVCDSKCSHSVNSCHYGGVSGSQGAMGVDYNAKAPYTEEQLYNAISAALAGPCSGLAGYKKPETDHTHLSVPGCSGN